MEQVEEESHRTLLTGRTLVEEDAQRRQLLSGRSLKKSGGKSSSYKSKSKSPPAKSPPAKRPPLVTPSVPSKGTTAASYTGARRRIDTATARRRQQPVPTGARRRINSPVDGKKWTNPTKPQTGNYGYASQSKINSNYPGGYSSSSYGYVGANAHKANSNKNMMMKVAAGAAVGAGVGVVAGYYIGSRWGHNGWGYRNRQCVHSSGFSGTCTECYKRYDGCSRLQNRAAARDDVMAASFIPIDFKSPVNLTIFKIEGEDFQDLAGLCPPADWDGVRRLTSWTPKDPQPDLWITLSVMMELEEPLAADTTNYANVSVGQGPSWLLIPMLLVLSLCRRGLL